MKHFPNSNSSVAILFKVLRKGCGISHGVPEVLFKPKHWEDKSLWCTFLVWWDSGVSLKGRIFRLPEKPCWLYTMIALQQHSSFPIEVYIQLKTGNWLSSATDSYGTLVPTIFFKNNRYSQLSHLRASSIVRERNLSESVFIKALSNVVSCSPASSMWGC